MRETVNEGIEHHALVVVVAALSLPRTGCGEQVWKKSKVDYVVISEMNGSSAVAAPGKSTVTVVVVARGVATVVALILVNNSNSYSNYDSDYHHDEPHGVSIECCVGLT